MASKRRFIFLSDEFYNDYPSKQYPEMEQKHNRPYIQMYIEIDGVQYACSAAIRYSSSTCVLDR